LCRAREEIWRGRPGFPRRDLPPRPPGGKRREQKSEEFPRNRRAGKRNLEGGKKVAEYFDDAAIRKKNVTQNG